MPMLRNIAAGFTKRVGVEGAAWGKKDAVDRGGGRNALERGLPAGKPREQAACQAVRAGCVGRNHVRDVVHELPLKRIRQSITGRGIPDQRGRTLSRTTPRILMQRGPT